MRRARRRSSGGTLASSPVRVAVRIRPPGTPTAGNADTCAVAAEQLTLIPQCVSPRSSSSSNKSLQFSFENQSRAFMFDHVFAPDASQKDVYASALQPLLTPFLNGFNVTVLAYGQTGAGKTYTVGNKTSRSPAASPVQPGRSSSRDTTAASTHRLADDDGLLPRFLCDVFAALRQEPSVKTIQVSFLEIYCDEIRDLLQARSQTTATKHQALVIREDEHRVWVEHLRQLQVENVEKALELLNVGRSRQVVSANAINDTSSRSHAIYTMEVTRTFVNEIKKTKLTFVDLAGSERVKKTQVEGVQMRESIQINVGLLALGNVINTLGDDKAQKRRGSVDGPAAAPAAAPFVPYRSAKLTRLLRDSLGGNSMTLFIACVSPLRVHGAETLSTLQYANRARNIQNKVEKNVESISAEVSPRAQNKRLQRTASELEIHLLQEQVCFLKQQLDQAHAAATAAAAVGTNIPTVVDVAVSQPAKKSSSDVRDAACAVTTSESGPATAAAAADTTTTTSRSTAKESSALLERSLPVISVAKVSRIKPPSCSRMLTSNSKTRMVSPTERSAEVSSEATASATAYTVESKLNADGSRQATTSNATSTLTDTTLIHVPQHVDTIEDATKRHSLVDANSVSDVLRASLAVSELSCSTLPKDTSGSNCGVGPLDASDVAASTDTLGGLHEDSTALETADKVDTSTSHESARHALLHVDDASQVLDYRAAVVGHVESLHEDCASEPSLLEPLHDNDEPQVLDYRAAVAGHVDESPVDDCLQAHRLGEDGASGDQDDRTACENPSAASVSADHTVRVEHELQDESSSATGRDTAEHHRPSALHSVQTLEESAAVTVVRAVGSHHPGCAVESESFGVPNCQCGDPERQDGDTSADSVDVHDKQSAVDDPVKIAIPDSEQPESGMADRDPASVVASDAGAPVSVTRLCRHADARFTVSAAISNSNALAAQSVLDATVRIDSSRSIVVVPADPVEDFERRASTDDCVTLSASETTDNMCVVGSETQRTLESKVATHERSNQDEVDDDLGGEDDVDDDNTGLSHAVEKTKDLDPATFESAVVEPDYVLLRCEPLPRLPQLLSSHSQRRARLLSPHKKHAVRPMNLFAFDDLWDKMQHSQPSSVGKLESLIKSTQQLLKDDFGSHDSNNQDNDDDDEQPQAAVATVDACLELLATYFAKRQQSNARCSKLKQRLRQFETLLGFPRGVLSDDANLCTFVPVHQETLLQQHIDFCEAIAAQRVYKRLQSYHDAQRDGLGSSTTSSTSLFLSADQVAACLPWLEPRNLLDRAYFQQRVLPLVLNSWIAVTPRDLEAEDAWLAL